MGLDGELDQDQSAPERYVQEPDLHETGDVGPGGLAPEILDDE